MPDQFNLCVIGSKSGVFFHFNSLINAYNYWLCCCPKVERFYALTTRSGRQEHVLHKNKCGNLMLTLRSCSNKLLTS